MKTTSRTLRETDFPFDPAGAVPALPPVMASNMIFAVKRRFQSALKRHLRQSVARDDDVGEEIQELSRFLARRRQYRQ